MNKYNIGMKGQKIAEEYLIKQDIKIISYNYRTKYGEIDLIALDGEYIVFIEVKYRSSLKYGSPAESVGFYKQQKIIKTALCYLCEHEYNDIRFDIIEVLGDKINHIKNAFFNM